MVQAEVGMTKISDSVWAGSIPAFSQSTSITYSIRVEEGSGNIVNSATVENPSYTVLFDPQTSTPSPIYTVEPSAMPTSRPLATLSPTQTAYPSPSTNDSAAPSQQKPTSAPLEKTDSAFSLQQIYPVITVISVAVVAIASFLIVKKHKRKS